MSYQKKDYNVYFANTSCDYQFTDGDKSGVKSDRTISYKSIKYRSGLFTKSVEYEVYYDESRKVIEVNFEQTNGILDWFVNFDYPDSYYDSFDTEFGKIKLRVHHGWNKMYKACKNAVRNEVIQLLNEHQDCVDIDIIGWSLGSGIAQLCLQDLSYILSNWDEFNNINIVERNYKLRLYTFGTVKPFFYINSKTKKYLSSLGDEIHMFGDVNDVVTYVPPFIHWHTINHVTSVDYRKKNFKVSPIELFKPLTYHTHYNSDDELYYKNTRLRDI